MLIILSLNPKIIYKTLPVTSKPIYLYVNACVKYFSWIFSNVEIWTDGSFFSGISIIFSETLSLEKNAWRIIPIIATKRVQREGLGYVFFFFSTKKDQVNLSTQSVNNNNI